MLTEPATCLPHPCKCTWSSRETAADCHVISATCLPHLYPCSWSSSETSADCHVISATCLPHLYPWHGALMEHQLIDNPSQLIVTWSQQRAWTHEHRALFGHQLIDKPCTRCSGWTSADCHVFYAATNLLLLYCNLVTWLGSAASMHGSRDWGQLPPLVTCLGSAASRDHVTGVSCLQGSRDWGQLPACNYCSRMIFFYMYE